MPGVVFRNGNQTNAAKRTPDQPAPTIMFGARSNKVEWMDADLAHDPSASGVRVTIDEAATLQSYNTPLPESDAMTEEITALDLFAGTGWGVACQRLGIEERGVELMDEAVATRTANGMETVYRDVWDGLLLDQETHELLYGAYNLLIASPPCQTFSVAGNGAGRKALNEVIEAIQLHAYKDPAALLEFGEKHDPRTALVLTPLAYVYRDRPTYVALEQVPTVLPAWEACAEVMREMGYSVKTAVLYAEQYGVPQTRKRAILVARLDDEVQLPVPTHSRYYSTNPAKLDPGVKKWVSMAEALGWIGAAKLVSNYGTGGDSTKRGERMLDQPAPTLTSKADRNKWDTGQALTDGEASTLQTYPPFTWCGNKSKVFLQIGNAVPPLLGWHVLRALTEESVL